MVDAAGLLRELIACAPDERAARYRAGNHAASFLIRLGDEAEHLAFVEVDLALKASHVVIELADAFGDAEARARARRAAAQAYAYAGRHEAALAAIEEARRIADEGGARTESARALAISLHPLGELGRYDDAVSAGLAAREALLREGQPRLAARADFNLAGIFQNRDEPQRALVHLDRAAPVFADDPVVSGYLQNNRGEILLSLHDFAGAECAFRAAIEASLRAGADVAAAIALGNLADLAGRQGRLAVALRCFEEARVRLERVNAPSHLARLLAEHAETLGALGLPQDALEAFGRALPELNAHGLAWEAARGTAGKGAALLAMGRTDLADPALADAAERFDALGHAAARARANVLRAECARRQGRIALAEVLLADARPVLANRPLEAARCGYVAGRLALDRGRPADADAAFSAALAEVEPLDVTPLVADLLHGLGRSASARGDVGLALDRYRRAVDEIERLRGALQAERFRSAFLGDRREAYEDLALALLALESDAGLPELFRTVERAKSRSLLDSLARALAEGAPDAEAGSDPELAAFHARAEGIRAELNALYARLSENWPASEEAREAWRSAVHAAERELRAVETRIASRAPLATLHTPPAELDEVCSAIEDDTVLIEYFAARGALFALVIRADGARVVRDLPDVSRISELVERARFQFERAMRSAGRGGEVAARRLAGARRELAALHNAIFGPLEPHVPAGAALVFAPHGALHLAPLHALWDGSRYLLERHEVSYAPSAGVFAHLAASGTAPRRGTRLVVGCADDAAPRIEHEAGRVAAALSADTLIGDAATCAALRRGAREADLLHLACHGRFSARYPSASGLRLSDRWLTLADIVRLGLRADLVVLSGCDTGRNVVTAGDELVGLLRAFLSAGARSVIATLWPAHDETTENLMIDFYNHWRSGGGAAKRGALREAQLGAMERDPHPLLWAPFILVGQP